MNDSTPNLLVILKELMYFRMEGYQNDSVAEGYQNGAVVVKCEYVYDQGKEVDKQNDKTFSDPYSDESSDKDGGNHPAKTMSSDIKTSKTSKKKKRRSYYDEDNYALPDPETDDDVKIRKLESKAKANKKQARNWRATSFVLIGLLFISATCIAYLVFENVKICGKTISTTLETLHINISYFYIFIILTKSNFIFQNRQS